MSSLVVAGIQARLSSSRLPGKVLADLGGQPLILRVVERVRAAKRVDEVYVLTSDEPSDDRLVEVLEEAGVAVRRGPLDDVLARYGALLEERDPGYVVRVTGDAPLVDPDFLDLQLEALAAHDGDLVQIAGGSQGFEGVLGGVSAMSARALRAGLRSSAPEDREHVASFYFRRHASEFRFVEVTLDASFRRDGVRLSVDEPLDLELMRRIYALHEEDRGGLVALRDVLRWLDEDPGLREINANVRESADNRRMRRLSTDLSVEPVGRFPA